MKGEAGMAAASVLQLSHNISSLSHSQMLA